MGGVSQRYRISRKVLNSLDERIPDGTGTIDWGRVVSDEFMAWWLALIMTTWYGIDVGGVYRKGGISDCLVLKTPRNVELILI